MPLPVKRRRMRPTHCLLALSVVECCDYYQSCTGRQYDNTCYCYGCDGNESSEGLIQPLSNYERNCLDCSIDSRGLVLLLVVVVVGATVIRERVLVLLLLLVAEVVLSRISFRSAGARMLECACGNAIMTYLAADLAA